MVLNKKTKNSKQKINVMIDKNKTRMSSSPRIKYAGKKLKILTGALHVISERGIREATVSEIAKTAGVVDSIIYHYFKDKEDLLLCVLDFLLKKVIEDLEFHFKGIMGPVSKLGKLVWYHSHMNDRDEHSQVRINMRLELRGKTAFIEHEVNNTLKAYIEILDNILKAGIQEGYFSSDLIIPVTRTMIFGFLDEMSLQRTGPDISTQSLPDFEEHMEVILAMIENRAIENDRVTKTDKYISILVTAKKLFSEKGFDATTMLDIAMQAGVAEGTIYEYFKNKQDLLLSITKEYFKLYKVKLDNAFKFETAIDKLRHIMWHHITIFAADKDLVTVFLRETKISKAFYETDASLIYINYHKKIIEILDEGKASGEFRRGIDNFLFCNLVMGSLTNLYNRWYYRNPISPMEFTVELHQFIELLCRAAAVPAQRNLREYHAIPTASLPGL